MLRVEKFFTEQLRRRLRHARVFAPVAIFRPGVEMKMHDGRFRFPLSAFRFSDKNRPRVTRPPAIRRMRDEANLSQVHADVFENPPCLRLIRRVAHDEIDAFAR